MFGKILSLVADNLSKVADRIRPKPPEPIAYFPPQPIGEIIEGKHRGVTAYFWKREERGTMVRSYLSRDKQKAIARREELSGWLIEPEK